ncbi:MAG: LLM class flavin-dependent oxidoreductase [Verrucomicrobiota bacterium]
MEITHGQKTISSFAISPRTLEPESYWKNVENVGQWCRDYRFTGPLLFTGNDTFVEPWVCAQSVVERFGCSPLVAVNPVFMHPFSVAKMVSSYAYTFKRKVYLNMVTGTSLSQHEALNDRIDHDAKYDRLREYIEIIQQLITASPGPVTYEGNYYEVKDLALVPPVDEALMPEFFIAGHSEKATEVREKTNSVGMQMLMPGLAADCNASKGIHFGLVTRKTEEAAWAAAEKRFPESERGKFILERSMKNTDSVWKKRLKFAADTLDQSDNGYWLAPFRSFQADCPYFIGSHAQVRDLVVSLIGKGIEHIILDVPPEEQEFAEIASAYQLAQAHLDAAWKVSAAK